MDNCIIYDVIIYKRIEIKDIHGNIHMCNMHTNRYNNTYTRINGYIHTDKRLHTRIYGNIHTDRYRNTYTGINGNIHTENCNTDRYRTHTHRNTYTRINGKHTHG